MDTTPTIEREATFTCIKDQDPDREELKFRRMEAREDLGRPYLYRLELVRLTEDNRKSPIKTDDLLGTRATVKLRLANGGTRYFNGWISAAEQGGIFRQYDVYRVEMRPWLWHLSLGSSRRIFQDKTTLQIIEAVFEAYSHQTIKKELSTGGQRKRHYCVQYGETDLNFISRLMEEDGLYYYFEHAEDSHTLVLCDGSKPHPAPPGLTTMLWAPDLAGKRMVDNVLQQFQTIHTQQPLKYRHSHFNYLKPSTKAKGEATRTNAGGAEAPGTFEMAGTPGEFAEPDNDPSQDQGESLAQVKINAWSSEGQFATAVTPTRNLAAGQTFTFTQGKTSTEYLITGSSMDLDFGDYEATHEEASAGFSARLTLHRSTQKFATELSTPRPRVQGPQTAIVVGNEGSELGTDEHGRIKVKFHWDESEAQDESCSCWVRVMMPWASKGFGMMSLPRVGDEVVIDFLEGNPDHPIAIGSVYNADNKPPYALPGNATVSGIRSRSSTGGGADNFNELRFDDKAGSEYIWMQAEKDFHRLVKNNDFDTVKGEQWHAVTKQAKHHYQDSFHLEIDKKAVVKIGDDTSAHIAGDLKLKVDGGVDATVGKAMQLKVTQGFKVGAQTLDLKTDSGIKVEDGANISIKAGANLILEAGAQLSLSASGSFITIGPDGVSISGKMVLINSGGSAGSASSPDAASPAAPDDPAADQENTDPLA